MIPRKRLFFTGRDQYYSRLIFLCVCCSRSTRRLNRENDFVVVFWRSPVSNLRPLVYKTCDLTTASRRLPFFFLGDTSTTWAIPVLYEVVFLWVLLSREHPKAQPRGWFFIFLFFFFPRRHQYYRRLFFDVFCGFVVPGAPEGSTGRRFFEKPGIEPATPGLFYLFFFFIFFSWARPVL